jgi:hypothetical protein
MKVEGRLRRLHRLATLVVGAQLVIWTVTGFAFTWFDFGQVRGAGDRKPEGALPLDGVQVGAVEAATRAGGSATGPVTKLELKAPLGRPTWLVSIEGHDPVRVDAIDGRVLPAVDERTAGEIARAAHSRAVAVASVDRVTRAGEVPDLDVPVYRVRLDDGHGTDVFVSPTGEVVAWRNDVWRQFDRLWSLHVLGYINRDNPAHPALRVLGGLALVVSLTGVGLWAAHLVRRRRAAARASTFAEARA